MSMMNPAPRRTLVLAGVLLGLLLAATHAQARTFVSVTTPAGEVFDVTGTGRVSVYNADGDTGWSAEGRAIADHGISRAIVTAMADGVAVDPRVSAYAGWEDVFTVSGGTPGTSGTLTLGVTITGLFEGVAGDVNTMPRTTVQYTLDRGFAGTSVAGFSDLGVTGSERVETTLVGTYGFIYGESFRVRGNLELEANVTGFAPLTFGLAEADFLGTAVVSQLVLPAGATLSTLSGAHYPVPLPASLWLLASVLIAGAVRRTRRIATP